MIRCFCFLCASVSLRLCVKTESVAYVNGRYFEIAAIRATALSSSVAGAAVMRRTLLRFAVSFIKLISSGVALCRATRAHGIGDRTGKISADLRIADAKTFAPAAARRAA